MYQPEKLKARRKELKLTQKDIADQLGVSYQAYSAWERGVKKPFGTFRICSSCCTFSLDGCFTPRSHAE